MTRTRKWNFYIKKIKNLWLLEPSEIPDRWGLSALPQPFLISQASKKKLKHDYEDYFMHGRNAF